MNLDYLSKKEKEELKRCSKEDPELFKAMTKSVFLEPTMHGDLDMSLMTFIEMETYFRCAKEHEDIVRKRAEELKFHPDLLTLEESDAVHRCLSFKELTSIFKFGSLIEKNQRLQEKLSLTEKVDVRGYCSITWHFSKFGPCFEKDFSDPLLKFVSEQYFEIMQKYREKVHEKPLSFLTAEQKRRVDECKVTVSDQ